MHICDIIGILKKLFVWRIGTPWHCMSTECMFSQTWVPSKSQCTVSYWAHVLHIMLESSVHACTRVPQWNNLCLHVGSAS